jgi:hypothetical protein
MFLSKCPPVASVRNYFDEFGTFALDVMGLKKCSKPDVLDNFALDAIGLKMFKTRCI